MQWCGHPKSHLCLGGVWLSQWSCYPQPKPGPQCTVLLGPTCKWYHFTVLLGPGWGVKWRFFSPVGGTCTCTIPAPQSSVLSTRPVYISIDVHETKHAQDRQTISFGRASFSWKSALLVGQLLDRPTGTYSLLKHSLHQLLVSSTSILGKNICCAIS